MKLESLFEPRKHTAPTMRAELAAVRKGAKPIAMETWPAGHLDEDYDAFVSLARARGLDVVERRHAKLLAVYALRPAEAWRIDALHALWDVAHHGWSDTAEALESHLLGYTPAQIRRWLAEKHRERLGWRGVTIHLLLPRAVRRYIGPRWFPHGRGTIVWCDGAHVRKRRLPAWVAKQKLVLARAAIPDDAFLRIFRRRGWLRAREVDPAELNPLLLADIELR